MHKAQCRTMALVLAAGLMPMRIFFDKDGKEVFRHVGFFPKDQITAKLAEMGVN